MRRRMKAGVESAFNRVMQIIKDGQYEVHSAHPPLSAMSNEENRLVMGVVDVLQSLQNEPDGTRFPEGVNTDPDALFALPNPDAVNKRTVRTLEGHIENLEEALNSRAYQEMVQEVENGALRILERLHENLMDLLEATRRQVRENQSRESRRANTMATVEVQVDLSKDFRRGDLEDLERGLEDTQEIHRADVSEGRYGTQIEAVIEGDFPEGMLGDARKLRSAIKYAINRAASEELARTIMNVAARPLGDRQSKRGSVVQPGDEDIMIQNWEEGGEVISLAEFLEINSGLNPDFLRDDAEIFRNASPGEKVELPVGGGSETWKRVSHRGTVSLPPVQERIAMIDRLRRRTLNATGRDWPVPPDADGSVPEEHGRPYESWDRWQDALEEYVLDLAEDIQAGSKSLYDRMTYPTASEPEWGIMEFDFRGWTLQLYVEGWMTIAENDLGETLFHDNAINPRTIETSLRRLATDMHRALEPV